MSLPLFYCPQPAHTASESQSGRPFCSSTWHKREAVGMVPRHGGGGEAGRKVEVYRRPWIETLSRIDTADREDANNKASKSRAAAEGVQEGVRWLE